MRDAVGSRKLADRNVSQITRGRGLWLEEYLTGDAVPPGDVGIPLHRSA